MSSTLICHAGAHAIDRDALATLPTPLRTRTFRPVPHHDLATGLVAALAGQGVAVAREQWAVQRRKGAASPNLLFGVLDLDIPGLAAPDLRFALGIRTANDRTMALRLVTAARVFVCDNLAFSGQGGAVTFTKRHTSGLDLGRDLPAAVEGYLGKVDGFRAALAAMRRARISDTQAKAILFDAFAGPATALPAHLFRETGRLYFDDAEQRDKFPDRTVWALNNAFTEAVKQVEAPDRRQVWGERIGAYFGALARRGLPGAAGAGWDYSLPSAN